MDYTKEFLLASAVGLMGYATTLIREDFWQGLTLALVATAMFIGRGFYKKYIDKR